MLPFVDEHTIEVEASLDALWDALLATLDRPSPRGAAVFYGRIVGCADWKATGPRPLATGSTVPGFRVTHCSPSEELVLEGSHRFSTYALSFYLTTSASGMSRLRAETRAEFPGLAGRAYRGMVIGTSGHVVGMRRLLSAIARRCR